MRLGLKNIGDILTRYRRKCEILFRVNSTFASKSEDDNPKISNLDDMEKVKKRRIVEMELEMLRQSGEFYVPDKLSETDWTTLLAMRNLSHRKNFLRSVKKRKISSLSKETKIERFERLESDNLKNNFIYDYDVSKKSIFCLSDFESRMDQFYTQNLAHAVQFGQQIVFDLDYNHHMSNYEIKNCVNQLAECYKFNKIQKIPFHIYFCNVKPEQSLTQKLFHSVSSLTKSNSLVTVTDDSYLNLFPNEKLIYLSPDSSHELTKFNHNDVYILGCVVEKGLSKPISKTKAKNEKIRTARLPFNRLIEMHCGQKCLTLDQVLKILLSAKSGENWTSAFLRETSRNQRGREK